jgi:hypothetical protein
LAGVWVGMDGCQHPGNQGCDECRRRLAKR